jgi:DNA-binding NarL/FixJ family response regulator
MSVRIIIADDHKIVRQGLRSLLENEKNYAVIAEADNGRSVIQYANELKPDIVIMDISMPDINGIDATRQIRSEQPDVKIIALSMHSDARYVLEMLDAGASGYLLKDCAMEELTQAIQNVISNQWFVSPAIAGVLIRKLNNRYSEVVVDSETLSPREQVVLRMLADGMITKNIAAELNVSIKTIETHRQHIMEKLGLHSVAELTKYAIRKGLTSLEK